MTAHREASPGQLFLWMIGGIALTSVGPILLVLILIVHVKFGGHILADSPRDVLRGRIAALCAMTIGLPAWFFTQLRLARSIRDGEWLDHDLRIIRRIVSARSLYLIGLLASIAYVVAICLRGSLYWLTSASVLVFPVGAFHDLSRQFIARESRGDAIEWALRPRLTEQ